VLVFVSQTLRQPDADHLVGLCRREKVWKLCNPWLGTKQSSAVRRLVGNHPLKKRAPVHALVAEGVGTIVDPRHACCGSGYSLAFTAGPEAELGHRPAAHVPLGSEQSRQGCAVGQLVVAHYPSTLLRSKTMEFCVDEFTAKGLVRRL